MLILLATRIESRFISNILARTYFTNIAAEIIGFSRGIWVIWDDIKVHVESIYVDDQFVNSFVWMPNTRPRLLTTIYTSTKSKVQQLLWDYLGQLEHVADIPWLLVGDFNQVLHQSEKKGELPVAMSRVIPFQNLVNNCALIDLGFSGPSFT